MVKYLVSIEAELNTPSRTADDAENSFRESLSEEVAWALSNGDDTLQFDTIEIADISVGVYSVELTDGDLDEVIQDRDDYPEFFVDGRATFTLDVWDDSLSLRDVEYYLECNIPSQTGELELSSPEVEFDN